MTEASPEKDETKARRWFDLATIRGWIEAVGALVGVVAAAVGVYLQLNPAKPATGTTTAPAKSVTTVEGTITQTGTGNVVGSGNVVSFNISGYTIEQHEERLKKQEAKLRSAFQQTGDQSDENRAALKTQLDTIQGQLVDIDKSYNERLSELKQANEKLEKVRDEVPADRLEQAVQALERGDTEAAEYVVTELVGVPEEKEPNNEARKANPVKVNRWIPGVIDDSKDTDFYSFKTPPVHRDWIRIKIENQSATLRPRLDLYNADKARIDGTSSGTAGANLTYHLVSGPNTKHYLKIGTYDKGTKGPYQFKVMPLAAYDGFEPNNEARFAKQISLDTPIEAGIMDRRDEDFYQVKTGASGAILIALLENGSSTLRPRLEFYNSNRAYIDSKANGTKGANLGFQVKAEPNTIYYVKVGNYDKGTRGPYTLTVKMQ